MRIQRYMLALVLCAPATCGVVFAQTQQGQSSSSTAQTADRKQAVAAALTQNAPAAATDASKPKPASKPVVFTNENLHDAAANKGIQAQSGSQPATQKNANAQANQTSQAPKSEKQQSPAAAPAKPKVELDPHKVLTNDDLRKLDRQGGMSVVGSSVDLSTIYDCDINCYNQVRSTAQVYPSSNLDWMRDLRTRIEQLKLDNDWRAYLVRLADLRSKICTIADDERTALHRADNEDNVTDEQINIREEFAQKLKSVNDDITAEYGRMNSMQSRYSPLVSRFMYTQVLRIMTTNCPGSPYYYGSDDPEDVTP